MTFYFAETLIFVALPISRFPIPSFDGEKFPCNIFRPGSTEDCFIKFSNTNHLTYFDISNEIYRNLTRYSFRLFINSCNSCIHILLTRSNLVITANYFVWIQTKEQLPEHRSTSGRYLEPISISI